MKQVVALLGLATWIASTPTVAIAAAPAASTVGVVDTERVSGEYKAMQILNEQFLAFQQQQDAQIVRRQKSRMLFDHEQREYLDRSAPTAAPTAERDKLLAEFEKLSDDRSKRLLDLGQRKDRSVEEEQEYQKLDQIYKQRTQELAALQTDVQKAIRAKSDEFMRIITESFEAAVKAVAEEKKLSMALRKEMVLYGGTDITEDVIRKLNQAPLPHISSEAGAPGPLPAASQPAQRSKPAEMGKQGAAAAE